jgi:hypothetical protein
MMELQAATGLEDRKIIKNTTKGLLINLVRFTFLMKRVKNQRFAELHKAIEKRAKGRARLGWWPAWKALSMKGAPLIGNGPLKDRGEGGIVDRSNAIMNPFITVFNEVPYIDSSDEKKRTLKAAVDRQFSFLVKSVERSYSKLLKGKSG